MKSDRTALYRLRDLTKSLLYVGITANPPQRFAGHRATKPWWHEVAEREIVWHETRDAAARAEKLAIRTESPKYNRSAGTGRPVFALNPAQANVLQRIAARRRILDEIDSEIWNAILLALDVGVPIAVLAERQDSFSRSTIHRRLREGVTSRTARSEPARPCTGTSEGR